MVSRSCVRGEGCGNHIQNNDKIKQTSKTVCDALGIVLAQGHRKDLPYRYCLSHRLKGISQVDRFGKK